MKTKEWAKNNKLNKVQELREIKEQLVNFVDQYGEGLISPKSREALMTLKKWENMLLGE